MSKKQKILVAMSGGVDSSVAAHILINRGYNVIGVTLDFKIPCSEQAVRDAKRVAKDLGIEHFVLNCETKFQKNVVDYFVDAYIRGTTPNPCAICNRTVKFAELIDFMRKIDADFVATGHYAKVMKKDEDYELHKGKDDIKDQSYFLSFLEYGFLKYIQCPLGGMTKKEVREYAKKAGLYTAEKTSSQDACFIDKDYKSVVNKYSAESFKKGDILHVDGKKLGEHNGTINYTIGQRKGLGIGYKSPLYVVRIDSEKNAVYVGSEKNLYSKEFGLFDVSLLDRNIESGKKYRFTTKLRSTHKGEKADAVFDLSNGTAKVKMFKPTRAITNGQLCTFYSGKRVAGSGFIK